MNATEAELFRHRAKQMVDYAAEYLSTLRNRKVLSEVKPGYLRPLIPDHAPEDADQWDDVMKDIERVIMPGITHWQSPQFHAYFPNLTSHPSICAQILTSTLNCNGFNWNTSPAVTELEVSVMDWLGKLLQLPDAFTANGGGQGGGVIHNTASESTLMCMLAAKCRAIDRQMKKSGQTSPHAIWEKLVAYTSDQAHCSVLRAGLFVGVEVRTLPTDAHCGLRGPTLEEAIAKDRANGKIPFMVVASLGTTSTLGFDNLLELGPIVEREDLWMHIDAAYAGSAFMCPEFRPLLDGVEYAHSFNFNPYKLMMINFECSALWVRNIRELTEPFTVTPPYFQPNHLENDMPDFRHWQIPMSRGFRSLKLWFVLRLFGAKQLREHIRGNVVLAKMFEDLVKSDSRFEVVYPVVMGLVCFRLKGDNELSEELIKRLNERRLIHLLSTTVNDTLLLRFVVCSPQSKPDDINFAWQEISSQADQLQLNKCEQVSRRVQRIWANETH